jgi:hypothetical protein
MSLAALMDCLVCATQFCTEQPSAQTEPGSSTVLLVAWSRVLLAMIDLPLPALSFHNIKHKI